MKIFKALASGFCKTLKAWHGILLIWLGSLLTVSLVALPVKEFFKSALGGSMITERLMEGIDVEVLGDIGSGFRNLISSFPMGWLLLILTGILLGAFLNGGIFNRLKASSGKFSFPEFFRASAKNFWPFLVISVTISLIICMLSLLIIVLPVVIVAGAESTSASETAPILTALISIVCFLLISLIFTLAADYARAWHVAQERQACFAALGFGFRRAFGTFMSSYPMMLVLFVIQVIFTLLVMVFLSRWKAETGSGVFLLFVVSQMLFYIKTGLKVWRYGSVTALKEINDTKEHEAEIIVNPAMTV